MGGFWLYPEYILGLAVVSIAAVKKFLLGRITQDMGPAQPTGHDKVVNIERRSRAYTTHLATLQTEQVCGIAVSHSWHKN